MSLAQEVFKGCSTPAQFYQAMIKADRFLVPAELIEVFQDCEQVLADAPHDVYKAMRKTHKLVSLLGDEIRPYTRRMLAQHVVFFETPTTLHTASRGTHKRLLICFAGNAGRLMLPTSVLLQQLPLDGVDVVLLGDPSGLGFLRGVNGYGEDLHLCLQRLMTELPASNYAGVHCLGTSGGGAASLYAGLLVNADAALSIGGHHPTVARKRKERAESLGISGLELDELVERHAPAGKRKTRLGAMYAEHHEADRLGAEALVEKLKACALLKVKGMEAHEVMYLLSQTGDLPRILTQHLFGDLHD
jgi:hypothetical protein